ASGMLLDVVVPAVGEVPVPAREIREGDRVGQAREARSAGAARAVAGRLGLQPAVADLVTDRSAGEPIGIAVVVFVGPGNGPDRPRRAERLVRRAAAACGSARG